MKNDIIDLLYLKKDEENLLPLNDKRLAKLDTKIEQQENIINELIETQVHPKCRDKLKMLINKKEKTAFKYMNRESQLIYKSGVSDGIKLILIALSME